jgi:HSP20 family protein
VKENDMTEMATEAGQENQTIDRAIQQVESLYRTVTGKDAPPSGEQPYRAIPPEKAPEQFVAEQVDRLIEALGSFGVSTQRPGWSPPLSIWEGRNEIVLRLDLPGVPQDAVQVTASLGRVEISGQRRPSNDADPTLGLRYGESPHGAFQRTVPLPAEVDVNRLHAQLRDGVLEIHVPRHRKPSEARPVPVN